MISEMEGTTLLRYSDVGGVEAEVEGLGKSLSIGLGVLGKEESGEGKYGLMVDEEAARAEDGLVIFRPFLGVGVGRGSSSSSVE